MRPVRFVCIYNPLHVWFSTPGSENFEFCDFNGNPYDMLPSKPEGKDEEGEFVYVRYKCGWPGCAGDQNIAIVKCYPGDNFKVSKRIDTPAGPQFEPLKVNSLPFAMAPRKRK